MYCGRFVGPSLAVLGMVPLHVDKIETYSKQHVTSSVHTLDNNWIIEVIRWEQNPFKL